MPGRDVLELFVGIETLLESCEGIQRSGGKPGNERGAECGADYAGDLRSPRPPGPELLDGLRGRTQQLIRGLAHHRRDLARGFVRLARRQAASLPELEPGLESAAIVDE